MGTRQSPLPYHNITHPPLSSAPSPSTTSHHHQQRSSYATFAPDGRSAVSAPHQRHPDLAYLPAEVNASRSYSSEPQASPHHSRALSSSSLPSARELSRAMPPPNSPPHQGNSHHQQHSISQQPPSQSHSMGGFGAVPPPPRAPPVALGPPSAFPSNRELPALGSIARSGSTGSSMSISSILGGPPPAPREPAPATAQQQHYSPHSAGPPGSGPGFTPSVHASPRMHSASSDFHPFRRPQTPDHHRPYDPRANPAQSPRGPYSTPEVQRYGTPQAYHSRHPSASADPGRMPPTAVAPPPRPSSQPKAFPGMRPGPDDRFGRREDLGRPAPGPEYNPERTGLRPYSYEDPYRADRERQGELEQREQERRERAYSGGDAGRQHMHPHEMGHRDAHRNQQQHYPRAPDSREPREPHWGRQPADPNYRPPLDHQRPPPQDYPPPGPYSQQGPPPAYPTTQAERYPPASHQPNSQAHPGAPLPPYDSPERPRPGMIPHQPHHEQQQQHQQQQQPPQSQHQHQQQLGQRTKLGEGQPPQPAPPSISYNNAAHGSSHFDASSQRAGEDALNHQRNLLNVLSENRKGRVSPLPQAVQGAQPQQPRHAAEPGIKSEFGRMFSGIGSGVGGLGVPSPITSGSAGPFTTASLAKREDVDAGETGQEPPTKGGKGRRRKLKDEDSRDDDSSDRLTPGTKVKRAKAHPHHHHHHHHHHHPRLLEEGAQGTPPFKTVKGSNSIPSPTDKNAAPAHHHHHHHHGPRPTPASQTQAAKQTPPSPVSTIPPRTRTTVSSQAVLDAVAKYPRHHIGDFIYEAGLKTGRLVPNTPVHRGFSSNPKPLPWELIKGKMNCILTVKVPRIHLSPLAREEITARGYLWGTDVYTDDSDVVAACIHGGWIKGEWSDDLDVSMLDIDQVPEKKRKVKEEPGSAAEMESENLITSPPKSGPMRVPNDRDLHVDVLILPRLAKYSATTRHGISSRDFGGDFGARHTIHDGLSYQIVGLRWVENGAQPQARLRGKARRERMRKAMQEVKGTFGNANGAEWEHDKRLRSEVPGNWWKPASTEEKGTEDGRNDRRSSDGDKENHVESAKTASEDPKEAVVTESKDIEMADVEKPKETAIEAER